MKKLMITAMVLSLMAGPALAGGSISGGTDNVSVGLLSGQTGTNGNAVNELHINGGGGQITLNGDHSVNFGSTNSGNVGLITNFSSSYIEAPSLSGIGDPAGDLSLTTVSSAAVGATSYYESGFAPEFIALGIDFDDALIIDD